jgi:hypothetical protein
MFAVTRLRRAFILSVVLVAGFSSLAFAQKKQSEKKPSELLPVGTPVAWRNPGDIAKRDLHFGPGSAELAPAAPFTFIEEIKTGVSPKFKVRDSRGIVWSVKMGEEAQAETVAGRLVWSMGYFADEAYYFDRVAVTNLPKLARGQNFVEGDTVVRGVRFEPKRQDVRRGDTWDWLENPFVGRREFNGLKVMMVLLANYDTRLDNNQIYTTKNPETGELEARYVVNDVGATLGRVGGLGGKRVKNNLEDFRDSKFVVNVENGMVNFDYNTKPKGAGGFFASVFGGGYAKRQANKEKAMRSIPVDDARWIGSQLAQLSDEQLRDAFRAANYDNATAEGFVTVLRTRINQLTQLPAATPVASVQTSGSK